MSERTRADALIAREQRWLDRHTRDHARKVAGLERESEHIQRRMLQIIDIRLKFACLKARVAQQVSA